jgi:hypothetical protein
VGGGDDQAQTFLVKSAFYPDVRRFMNTTNKPRRSIPEFGGISIKSASSYELPLTGKFKETGSLICKSLSGLE